MEFIYLAIGLAMAFLIVVFYRFGVRDGMAIKSNTEPKKLVEKPGFLMTKEEKTQKEEEKKNEEAQIKMQEAIDKLWNYQPKHTAERDGE